MSELPKRPSMGARLRHPNSGASQGLMVLAATEAEWVALLTAIDAGAPLLLEGEKAEGRKLAEGGAWPPVDQRRDQQPHRGDAGPREQPWVDHLVAH